MTLTTIALGFTLGCSLFVEPARLEAGCDSDQKACDGHCVSRTDPEYGCGATSCQPCVLPNATSICDAEEHCAIAVCVESHEDCDKVSSNGCEVNLDTDVDHCGACDAPSCEVRGAFAACARGVCAIRKCKPGFEDCNRLDIDGCETQVGPLTGDASTREAGSFATCNPWSDAGR
ncbi:MAG TPA: hypothetical protein VHM70_04790 [Polyangiaceae bacterium]|nr:hypothetical protein [Polyangiaceae bacterium]